MQRENHVQGENHMTEWLFEKKCETCRNSATIIQDNSRFTMEVLKKVYCPICGDATAFNPETMTETSDGWVIEHETMSPAKVLDVTDLNGGHSDLQLTNQSPKYTIVSFIMYPAPKHRITPFVLWYVYPGASMLRPERQLLLNN